MKAFNQIRCLVITVLLSVTADTALAQSTDTNSPVSAEAGAVPPPSAPAKRSDAELKKLVEPIALHPDPLIAIILPASAYPLEVVQAARFVKDTNNIPKIDEQPWDDNVKEVAKFPELIAKMDADISWTMQLGEAFVDQPKEVMDAIQAMRGTAKKAGTLKTSEQQIVTVTNIVVLETNKTEVVEVTKEVVQVVPANPQVVYVPSYPPAVYYPPPGYVATASLVSFGVGMAWGAALANNCNWGHSSVDVNVNKNVNRNTSRNTDRNSAQPRSGGGAGGQQQWKPNQSRMQQSGARPSSQEARGYGGNSGAGQGAGGARPSTQPSAGNRASTQPGAGNRASTQPTRGGGNGGGGGGNRPSTQPAGGGGGGGGRSPNASPSANTRPSSGGGSSSRSSAQSRSSSGGSAFGGSKSGGSARSSSSRGSSSRGGGGGGGGGRGGGGGGRR